MNSIEPWLLSWLLILGGLLAVLLRIGHGGVGLVVAYLLQLWLNHWVGAAASAFPSMQMSEAGWTLAGFEMTTYALMALAAGVMGCIPLLRRWRGSAATGPVSPAMLAVTKQILAIGIVCKYLLSTDLAQVPSLTALISGGAGFTEAGLVMLLWQGLRARRGDLTAAAAIVLVSVPLLTIITRGFLGYGVDVIVAVAAYWAVYYEPRWRVAAAGIVLAYVGLSVFVSYFQAREEIRYAVWGGQTFGHRVEAVEQAAARAEWFDADDSRHLSIIETRLNQNRLVGAAIEYTPAHVPYAEGGTLWYGVLALVPRALWWEKPVTAGSMQLVPYYTGIRFGDWMSVGMGHVLELYINFGIVGVVFGFVLLGALLEWIDMVAAGSLASGNWVGFLLWYVPGLSLLRVGGAFAETTASMLGAVLAIWCFVAIRSWIVNRGVATA